MTTVALRQWVRHVRSAPRSVTYICEQMDARYGIPRPTSAPHLPAYQAAMAFFGVCGEGVLIVLGGIVSAIIWWKIPYWLLISIEVELFCHMMAPVGVLISVFETTQLSLPYFHIFQRSTYV